MKIKQAAFTLVESIVAVAILSLVLVSVYGVFFSVLRTTEVGADAAIEVQRQRIALKTIEDAFSGLVYYEQNQGIYAFNADTEDYDYPSISFVTRVPPGFLGNKEFGSQALRRVTFAVEDDESYGRSLVMYQSSALQSEDLLEIEDPSRWVLGQDLDTFLMVFWSTINKEWVYEWTETNSIPTRIKFELAYKRADGSLAQVEDMQKREIVVFSESITQAMQNPALPAAKGGSGGSRGGKKKPSSGKKPTREQIDAWRKKQAENSGRDGKDGRSRYTDAQRAEWARKMKEKYNSSKNSNNNKSGSNNNSSNNESGSSNNSSNRNDGIAVSSNWNAGNAAVPGYTTINDAIIDYAATNGDNPPNSVNELVPDYLPSPLPDPPEGNIWIIKEDGTLGFQPL